jgi:hypothetical protein
MSTNEEVAVEAQRKFDYFLIALTFSVLSLALNTFKQSDSKWIDSAETIAWLLLLISGIFGLLRVKILHMIYSKYAIIERLEASGAHKKKPVEYQKGLDVLHQYEKSAEQRYAISWWMFVIGLIMIFLARAIPVIISICQE